MPKSRIEIEELLKEGCRRLLREKRNGIKINVKQTAFDLNIPYTTLRSRFLNIHKPAQEAHTTQQFLSPSQEKLLVKWIEHLGLTGRPLCKRTIRIRAQHLHPDNKRPSKNWIYAFLKDILILCYPQHPASTQNVQRLLTAPLSTSTLMNSKSWLNRLVFPLRIFITWTRRVARGVVGRRQAEGSIYTLGDSVPSTGIVVLTSNLSLSLRLYVQMELSSSQASYFPAHLSAPSGLTAIQTLCKCKYSSLILLQIFNWHFRVATSQNGWTDDFIGAEWFEKSFILQATARNKSGKPILLVLDGHGSHESSEIICLAEIHNIIILCLPPHTTHKLQPLDVGVFGPFQRAWLDRCDSIVELTGSEMPKEDFIREYMQVREESFRPSTIMSAFKKSGAWPIDRTVFTDDDFATSIPYSTEACDFPPLSEFESLPPLNLDLDHIANDQSDSDNDSDSEFDSDSDSEPQSHHRPHQMPVSHSHPTVDRSSMSRHVDRSSMSIPTPTPSTIPAAESHPTINSLPTKISKSSLSQMSPIPASQFYHDPVLFERISHLEASLQQLTGQVKMVELELQNEKRKNNQRDSRPSKRRKLNVEARVLTSEEGKRLAAEKDAERAAKEQKKREAATRRKQKENDREQQRRDRAPDAPFTGSLSSKSKPDLQEIAGALSLAEEGTKDVLVRRITTFFDSHPRLRDSERFIGLFNRTHKRRIDMNAGGATQIFNNPTHTPSASQPPSLPHIPLNTNIANLNLPIAGPSTTSHGLGVFTPVSPIQPQFNFYYRGM